MASCQTARWVSSAPYVKLTVTQKEDTDTSATLSWTLQYISDTPANTNGIGRAYTVKIGGSTVKEDAYNINGVTGTKTIASGTKTISKTTAAQTIAFSVSFAFNLTWSGTYGGTKSASGSISVAAKTSYKITYNANGGSGAPAAQTKWHGTNLVLSSTKPTRTGYVFQGWALTKADADAGTWYYQAGNTCGRNENLTLYAVWEANTYKITYNANGGSGAPAAQTKTYGVNLTLSSTKPTRANYVFKGWGTSASATSVTYAAGAVYKANAAATLYAIWDLSYVKPRITNCVISRCDSEGVTSDAGTHALVEFNWACDQEVSSITIAWGSESAIVEASGTSGSVGTIVGAGALSTEKTYTIAITVADSVDSNTVRRTLNGMLFAIDFLNGGDGVAFGKPAELHDYADFNFVSRFRKNQLLENNIVVYGKSTNDENLAMMYINASDNMVFGYGSYRNSVGSSILYGNTVNLTSRDGVFVDGKQLAVNKVLWSSTGYYMSEAQTATLSEAISAQANGVVLIWSEYTDGASVNANFNMQFIPKYFVSAFAAKGVGTIVTSATLNIVASKYVYISDTSITGYSTNNTGATTVDSGITRTSKNFVLRAVIGV